MESRRLPRPVPREKPRKATKCVPLVALAAVVPRAAPSDPLRVRAGVTGGGC